jgi:N-acetylmuramoyl-L-alanine amidase
VLPKKERAALTEVFAGVKERAGSGCLDEKKIQRIFLDPGHGGDDAGTKKAGVREKDVVLKFSRLVADELRRRGFTVSFSRTRDVFVPLEIRPKLAKEWKADLFVSLHVNSSPSSRARGTETYILSQEATDETARKLALLENSVAGKASGAASAVQDILWDMEQTAYLQSSAYLASDIQKAIVADAGEALRKEKVSGGWKNRGVRQAPFYVLNRAPMPAVLVEIAYLSNAQDRRLMGEKIFQESLAKAIAEGVKKYKEACRKSP